MKHRIFQKTLLIALLGISSTCFSACAQESALKLAGIFGNGMVLQRNTDSAIWGKAEPNSKISITPSWSKTSVEAEADADGKWKTTIHTPEAGGPFTISVKSGSQSVDLKNVLSGEVWLCTGQSNMQWKMRGFGVDHFKEDVVKANFPQIRFCDVPQTLAVKGQDDVRTRWTECNPQTVLNFSAVGYFFGSRLHQELNVPIGLVSTNWGGTPAESWVSEEVLREKFPRFNQVMDGFPKISKDASSEVFVARDLFPKNKKMQKGFGSTNPSVLYNAMIHPLIPFNFRGVIWYQGESNVKKPEEYRTLFPAMIRDWRQRWDIGDFPFYYVQIAPFAYKPEPIPVAFLREAQTMALTEPNTGMAVTMDIGEANNIHPRDKKPVGERLALLALARDYGKKGIVDSGPLYKEFRIQGDKIRLSFTNPGGGLTTKDGGELTHFTIAGADKKFVPATAVIAGETIVVSSSEVTKPIAVRFGWGNADATNLTNEAGLPSPSFRTDDWPIGK